MSWCLDPGGRRMRKQVSQYRRPPRPNMPLVCCPLWCLPVWSPHHTPPPSWFAVQYAASTADRGLRNRKRRAGGVVGGLGSGWVGGCVAPVMLRCLPDQQAQMSLALAQWLADPQRLKKTTPATNNKLAGNSENEPNNSRLSHHYLPGRRHMEVIYFFCFTSSNF